MARRFRNNVGRGKITAARSPLPESPAGRVGGSGDVKDSRGSSGVPAPAAVRLRLLDRRLPAGRTGSALRAGELAGGPRGREDPPGDRRAGTLPPRGPRGGGAEDARRARVAAAEGPARVRAGEPEHPAARTAAGLRNGRVRRRPLLVVAPWLLLLPRADDGVEDQLEGAV